MPVVLHEDDPVSSRVDRRGERRVSRVGRRTGRDLLQAERLAGRFDVARDRDLDFLQAVVVAVVARRAGPAGAAGREPVLRAVERSLGRVRVVVDQVDRHDGGGWPADGHRRVVRPGGL